MSIELFHGDYRRVLADVECDALITDPPYGARTHAGQRHGRKGPRYSPDKCLTGNGLAYASWSVEDVRAFVEFWAMRTRGWLCAMTSHDLVPVYTEALEAHGRYVFAPLACVQTGMNVRLAGDGPSNWTVHMVVSRPRTPEFRAWGTLPGAYVVGQDQGRKRGDGIGGGKPLDLMRAIVADYSRPGDLVCDPCGGGFTTAIAAHMEGRRAVSAERSWATFEKGCARAEEYLRQVPLFERVESAEPKQEVFAL